eukprot:CAMPEP_0119316160 /NCGR_PEP_ID=MMETSP1333-20130426/38772_1 /TAXON_ID=418940 /ORGANISM="Scyphosphaera apsteinii, Strain RCC1455" /LENGTH=295 /DNA_ID=CAMNT_0007321737 /DNA_START=247 /DNA_END=1134 /DNA_ORIENTATION=-
MDEQDPDEHPSPGKWSKLGAENFSVRCGPNYVRNGFKAASAPALGEVIAMDALRTKHKIFNVLHYNYIALPPATPGWSEPYAEFFIINQMIPYHFRGPNLFASEDPDGDTLNLISYVRIRPGLAPDWRSSDEPRNAEELLKRFLLRAEQDDAIAHCLKEIGMITNLEHLGTRLPASLMRICRKLNGKPILTRPQHFFHRDEANRYLAVDLDGHRYKLGTRISLFRGLSQLSQLDLAYGIVIEARKEVELPEVMTCCCKLSRMKIDEAHPFPPEHGSLPAAKSNNAPIQLGIAAPR